MDLAARLLKKKQRRQQRLPLNLPRGLRPMSYQADENHPLLPKWSVILHRHMFDVLTVVSAHLLRFCDYALASQLYHLLFASSADEWFFTLLSWWMGITPLLFFGLS
jgi:hypothetical protein